MERGLTLLIATLVVFMAISVQGTSHLSFAPNTTQVSINRTGCGTSKLCVETPDDCDPAGNDTCLFTSIVASTPVAPSGTMLQFELSGNSSGYIAVGLTVNASEGMTMLFICAQNGTFLFRTMNRNNVNNSLTASETRVTDIASMVKGDMIKCEFRVPNVNATQTRSQDTTFSVLLGSGPITGGSIGDFSLRLNSGPLNIADPTSNVVNATQAPNVTTTAATTMSGASDAFRPHAVLLSLSVLALSFLKSA